MKRILAVCYGGGHARMLRPVLDLLSAHPKGFSVFVLALTTGKKEFIDAPYKVVGFSDFFSAETDEVSLEAGNRLIESHHSKHTGIPFEESLAYLGLNYTDLVMQHGAKKAEELVSENGRGAFLPLKFMDKLFADIKPDFVLTTNSPRAELAARIVAKSRKIPVMAISDLIGSDGSIHDMEVDYLCVASKKAQKNYKNAENVHATNIALVGNPAMDYVVSPEEKSENKTVGIQNDKKWCQNRKHVLVAEQYGYLHESGSYYVRFTDERKIQNLYTTLEACRVNNAQMIVRPHPSLDPSLYINWCDQVGVDALMGINYSLNDIFSLSDLLISNLSTIMIDALYRKCPVLIVNYPDGDNLLPLDEMGFAQGVISDDQMSFNKKVGFALKDEKMLAKQQLAFFKEFPQLPCSPRIVDIIVSHFN